MSAFDRIQTYSSSSISGLERASQNMEVTNSKYDTSKPTGEFLAKLEAMHFNMSELEKVLICEDDQLIESGAGSGKSTTLIFKIMYDLIAGRSTCEKRLPEGQTVTVPDKIWVSTFLRSGADELKTKLGNWQSKLGYPVSADAVEFSTMHAEFKRVLTEMGVKINLCPTDSKSATSARSLLRKAINDLGILPSDHEKLNEDDYQAIEGMVTSYRNRLDESKYDTNTMLYYGMTTIIMDALVESFRQKRLASGVMDFEDLQELLYKYLYLTPNKAVQDFIASRYKYIYLDEFQDTSQIQYAILQFYARGRLVYNKETKAGYEQPIFDGLYAPYERMEQRIVACGDSDQCIYSWRGSDVRIISEWFERDFHPTVSQLTVNYRCPSNILKPVIPSIEKNTMRHEKPLVSFREGGEYNILLNNDLFFMLEDMCKRIEADVQNGLSVAVICRTNYDGVLPALYLEMMGRFKFSISGPTMTLDTALPRKLLAMASLFTERSSPNVKNSLSMFAGRQNEWRVAQMVKAMKNDNSSIWEVDLADVAYSCPDLLPVIKMLRTMVLDEDGKRVRENEPNALLHLYSVLYSQVYVGDSIFCLNARLFLSVFIKILEDGNFSSIFEFQERMSLYGDSLKSRIKAENAPVSVVTVHEFKGKERDSVYLWHDSVDTFPAKKCDLSNDVQFEEERRVHYIACTRARKKMTIYAQSSNLGRFLRELDAKRTELRKPISGSIGKESAETADGVWSEFI